MRQTTLYCAVGRAAPRPIITVIEDSPDAAAQLGGAQATEYAALINGGNAPARIQFSHESVDVETSTAPKKGKR
jgi:hypothetical protein